MKTIPLATPEERKNIPRWRDGTRRVVGFDIEEAYTTTPTYEYSPFLVRVACPVCRRRCAPLVSGSTRVLESNWEWVGIEYKQPFTDYLCRCPGCSEYFLLHTYVPQ